MTTQTAPTVYAWDVSEQFWEDCHEAGEVAWDIETSGLDFRNDHIGTCQLAVGDQVAIVALADHLPDRLTELLGAQSVRKVFHHAPFDLRFMTYQWKASVANVACTKVAAKVLRPGLESGEYSLKPTLKRFLGVDISKDQQRSDWLATSLSSAQLGYAADDVRYLVPLLRVLMDRCEEGGLTPSLQASFAYLPTRVELDLRGASDVFAY